MTLQDIRQLPVYQTRGIAEDAKNGDTAGYLVACLDMLYSGDYGIIPEDDTDENNRELLNGCGRIVARYPAACGLDTDIYIIADFNVNFLHDIDYSRVTVMYVDEY